MVRMDGYLCDRFQCSVRLQPVPLFTGGARLLESVTLDAANRELPLRDVIWAYRLAETVGDP